MRLGHFGKRHIGLSGRATEQAGYWLEPAAFFCWGAPLVVRVTGVLERLISSLRACVLGRRRVSVLVVVLVLVVLVFVVLVLAGGSRAHGPMGSHGSHGMTSRNS